MKEPVLRFSIGKFSITFCECRCVDAHASCSKGGKDNFLVCKLELGREFSIGRIMENLVHPIMRSGLAA